jgi:AcrR family transcriptional regulator
MDLYEGVAIRTRMLEATEALLAASPDRDISTRAVCDAVGVGAPMLYRLFGDKNGLLAAVVDYRFEQYLAPKRLQPPSEDPVDDLYAAWDNHVAFALDNPTVYRLVYAPSLAEVPAAAEEARLLLCERLERCAEVGKLNTPPEVAAQVFMAACAGVTLNLLSQPKIYNDPGLSTRVRDAILRELIVDDKAAPTARESTDPLKLVALQMAALIRRTPTNLTNPEVLLMLQWLDTISTIQTSAEHSAADPTSDSTNRRG